MYFGELALLRGEARAATVLAAGDCDLLALERAEFMRVMGPLAAQLEQQAAKYAGITSAKQARLTFCHPDVPRRNSCCPHPSGRPMQWKEK